MSLKIVVRFFFNIFKVMLTVFKLIDMIREYNSHRQTYICEGRVKGTPETPKEVILPIFGSLA